MFCADATLDAVLRRVFGLVVVAPLTDPSLQELSANYDRVSHTCRLYVDDGGGPMRPLEAALLPAAIIAGTRILDTLDGQSLSPTAAFLNCVLANGFRYHAALPPVTDGPSFAIRAHARLMRLLAELICRRGSKAPCI